ncbi:MAG: sporulation protein YabP [Thermoanaerobacteraceae bacterium]|nr:sporulation protein YabP [Thermoanaerobacteraceae bacterium]
MDEKKAGVGQNITLEDRKKISATGVQDVQNFSDDSITLSTTMGTLVIKGKNMHITRYSLEDGKLTIDGEIDSLTYSQGQRPKEKDGGVIKRIFK